MTIKAVYKVEGDTNEYDSEQEAQVAEACKDLKTSYLSASEKREIAKAVTEKYLLVPIIPVEHMNEAVPATGINAPKNLYDTHVLRDFVAPVPTSAPVDEQAIATAIRFEEPMK